MSLDFGGYSVDLTIDNKRVGHGHSDPQEPNCSIQKAIERAVATPEFAEACATWEKESGSLYYTMPVKISVLVNTRMLQAY